MDTNKESRCKACGATGYGKYCSQCGQAYRVERISLHSLLHDAFHFFTHLDKGFGYTVKQLIVAPGHMQRSYIEGDRSRHQKPFSTFFICATIAALSRYWLFLVLMRYYHVGDEPEAQFFHQYMVMLHVALLPLYTLLAYLFFRNAAYNYAETGVLTLYTVSVFFLIVSCIALLKFIWTDLDTAYIELPLLVIYSIVTFVNFFHTHARGTIIFKSILVVVCLFFMAHYTEKFVIQLLTRA